MKKPAANHILHSGSNLVEDANRNVPSLDVAVLTTGRMIEEGKREVGLKQFSGSVLVSLPRMVGVGVLIQQSEAVLAAGEVGEATVEDVLLDVPRLVNLQGDIVLG